MLEELKQKFDQLLWGQRIRELNRPKAFLLRALRILYATVRDFSGGLPSLRAMGLVYTTLLSIVPLLAVSFSVLKGFGAHNQLEPTLISLLEPLGEKGVQVSHQIIEFVDNMKVGILGGLGMAFLIFTVLSLVKKIESAFNFTWRISTTRNLFQRFSNYLSVILVGPLFLFTATGLNASFNSSTVVNKIAAIEPFGTLIIFLGEVTPYILTIITFTLIYALIPNTKVRFRSALYGAIAATIMWKIASFIFTSFIVNSTNYTAVYSGFAILIIFMLWVYASWLIVLTGASISYYHQNPDRIKNRSQVMRLSSRLREKLALTVMQLIAHNFHHNEKPWSLKALTKKTGISEPALMIVISSLISNKLITTSGKNNKYYQPACSLENIPVMTILKAARSAEETPQLHPDDVNTCQNVDDTLVIIEAAINDSLNGKTLKDLV